MDPVVNLWMSFGWDFTEEAKYDSLPMIDKLVEYAEFAKTNGLFALESRTEDDIRFLKFGVKLAIDGTHGEILSSLLLSVLLADKPAGVDLLQRLLIMRFILGIVQGENPKLLRMVLLAMLGEEYIEL